MLNTNGTILTGALQQLSTGHWIVEYPHGSGRPPSVIAAGDVVYLQIERDHWEKTRFEIGYIYGRNQFYSTSGFELRAGMPAAYLGEGWLF